MTNQKLIVIYRDKLLPYSETFIPAQAECLNNYAVIYTGIEKIEEINPLIDTNKIITLSNLTSNFLVWKKAFRLFALINSKWITTLKNLSPCLIHCHFGRPDGFWATKLAKKLKIPLIVTFHGYDITKQLPPIDSFHQSSVKKNNSLFQEINSAWNDFLTQIIYELPVERSRIPNWLTPDYNLSEQRRLELVFRESNCIIAISEFIGSELIKRGCPPEKIKVHYIGVDVEEFKPDASVKREPIVLFVGRLVEMKGCEYLIRAMAEVQKVIPNVGLVIIGDGGLLPKLEKLAGDLLNNYRFLGVQTPEQVKSWMNKSMLLVAPSITTAKQETEGLPIVILEAQAMGLPIVSSVHTGIPEAVIHEETGFLTSERDVEAISKYIVTLVENEKLREQFATAGRNLIETTFNLKKNNLELENIYTKIIKDSYQAKNT